MPYLKGALESKERRASAAERAAAPRHDELQLEQRVGVALRGRRGAFRGSRRRGGLGDLPDGRG